MKGWPILCCAPVLATAAPAFGQVDETYQAQMVGHPIVLVTARRIPEASDGVPISLVRLDAQRLQKQGADTLADIAGAVPNLTVPTLSVFGAEQPTIRGVFSPIGASTVGLYVDDVPVQIRSLEVAGNPDLRVFDLDRIEVLRGPQGTLFGAS